MEPKPPGWDVRYANVFQEQDVVASYPNRPPYPQDVIDRLARLGDSVVDAGCGTGELARRLAPLVTRVDAVDVSAPMLELAQKLAGADRVRWINARIEDARLDPPYDLVVAGDSVHWFDWEVALPRIFELAPQFAVVSRNWFKGDNELVARLRPVWSSHSWNREFRPLDPVAELECRGLLRVVSTFESATESWRPTQDEVVGLHFSQSGFARERLADAAAFEHDLRNALGDEPYELGVSGAITLTAPA
ncbi:MAG TPA: class I SAM-dependent methyltransferase [Gaiellaceae bacterium]|nr:class I SAM-dependent methyltransferase [Gaiellaceae bacterium]